MLHDSKLVVINQASEISFIHLKHALLEFCVRKSLILDQSLNSRLLKMC
jgi:hypothetical protein